MDAGTCFHYVQNNNQIQMIKSMKLKPSSPNISWETAAAMVAIPGTQQAWNPGNPSIAFDVPAIMEQSAQFMLVRTRLVEETTEITRYPAIELILMDGLLSYEAHEGMVNRGHYLILPQFPIVKQTKPGPDYSVDFCIGIIELIVSTVCIRSQYCTVVCRVAGKKYLES